MKLKKWLIALAVLFSAASCSGGSGPPEVVATTSVLSSVAQDIGGSRIRVVALVPAGSCPGHFDVKVHHLRLVEESGALLAHGFEQYLPDIKGAASSGDFKPLLVPIDGSWLTPQGASELYRQTADHLSGLFPEKSGYFQQNLERALELIEKKDREVRELIESRGLSGLRVICNDHLEGYLGYLGFEAAASYGRSEDLAPMQIIDIIKKGKELGAGLVVDNMQAGPDTGRVFSKELGVPHVAVSNFPSVLPGATTLYDTLLANAELIAEAMDGN